MTKHDQHRKNTLIRTLQKAKDQAEVLRLYLTANNRDPEDIATANLALEHIEIALEHLGAATERKEGDGR